MPSIQYPFHIPVADDARQALLDALQQWRTDAKPDELCTVRLGERCDLSSIGGGFVEREPFESFPGSCTASPLCEHFTWPALRGRPAEFDAELSGVDIQIVRPIQISTSRNYAQVYLGTLGGATVALKIYQNSLNKDLDKLSIDDRVEEWEPCLLSFYTEEWAYSQALELQGLVVPHICGFFQITLPHGEPAVVLVMEYIGGTYSHNISADDERRLTKHERLDYMARGLTAVIHALHNCSVLHCDLAKRNILWPSFDSAVSQSTNVLWLPVVLDFGNACIIEARTARLGAFSGAMGLLGREYGFKTKAVDKFIRSVLVPGSEFPRMFDVPDEELEEWASWCMTTKR